MSTSTSSQIAALGVMLWLLQPVPPALAEGDQTDSGAVLVETFEQWDEATEPGGQWQAFSGFRGTPPRVMATPGRNGGTALGVAHSEPFRADSWGIRRMLETPISEGVLWLECYFHPPAEWTGDVYLDARGGRSVVARIGGTRQSGEQSVDVFRVHASQTYSYWRIYQELPLEKHWYRLTMRLDLDANLYAAWVNDEILGEELPLCSEEPIDHVFLGLGGTSASPARIDDLRISRTPPGGRALRSLLPEPEQGLLFRMAVIGDPQVGFTTPEADLLRFQQTVSQVNRSGAELTLILGDMVHDADDEQAYRDVKAAAGNLEKPCYFVRGNHDRLDLFQKYFHPAADFAFTHKGWRFVFLDAIGNERGLTDEQLQFAEGEFRKAREQKEEIVVCLHVSPWEDNEKGRGGYNQIGPGRDRLVELLDQYGALFCLSGHYHRGTWHVEQQGTHYFVLGGTAQVKQGWLGWCTFDVYPDRVVVTEKPVYYGYVRPDADAFYNFNYGRWTAYSDAMQKWPYLQRGPAVISRAASAGGNK